MKPDCKKIAQVINYLSLKAEDGNDVPELKIIKLIWAADRYHLRKYARTVTRDSYVAMAKGPVGSTVKDVAEFEIGYGNVTDEDNKYSERYFKFYQTNGDSYITAISCTDIDELSQTDIEALDFALNNFGHMTKDEIIQFTHQYPEWKKHKHALLEEKRVEKINLLDFFQNPLDIKGDPFEIPEEILKNSKDIYMEYV